MAVFKPKDKVVKQKIEIMKKGFDLLVLFFSIVGLIGSICYLFYIKEYWMAVFVGLLGYVAWPEIRRRWKEFVD